MNENGDMMNITEDHEELYNWTDPETGIEFRAYQIGGEAGWYVIYVNAIDGEDLIDTLRFRVDHEPALITYMHVDMGDSSRQGVCSRYQERLEPELLKRGIQRSRMAAISEAAVKFCEKTGRCFERHNVTR